VNTGKFGKTMDRSREKSVGGTTIKQNSVESNEMSVRGAQNEERAVPVTRNFRTFPTKVNEFTVKTI
jgi:hypothetical protein